MVIVIAGILASTVYARLASRDSFDAAGFAEDVRALARYAQKAAIAQHTSVRVNVDAAGGTLTACYDSAYPCASPLPDPSGTGNLRLASPSTVVFTTTLAQYTLDWRGSAGGTAPVVTVKTSAGATIATVTVDPDTGYVH